MQFFARVIALSLFLLSTAYAQSPSQSAKFADSFGTLAESLGEANQTLFDMSRGMPVDSTDENAVSSITETLLYTGVILDRVQILATIHGMMQSPADQLIVKRFLSSSVKYALKANEAALANVNRLSVRVKSAAAIAELQKIREILQQCRKEMQQLVPTQ